MIYTRVITHALHRPVRSGLVVLAVAFTLALAPVPASAQAPDAARPFWSNASTRHEVWLTAGYASAAPDRDIGFLDGRVGSGLYRTLVRRNLERGRDKALGLGAAYRYRPTDWLAFGAGFGLARLRGGQVTLVDLQYFTPPGGEKPEPLIVRNELEVHAMQGSTSVEVSLPIRRVFRAGVTGTLNFDVSYRRYINYIGWYRTPHEPFATEVYPGVFAQVGPVRADFQVRTLHRKYRDDSVANNGLRVDPYNPYKYRFGLSYRLLRWPRLKAEEGE